MLLLDTVLPLECYCFGWFRHRRRPNQETHRFAAYSR